MPGVSAGSNAASIRVPVPAAARACSQRRVRIRTITGDDTTERQKLNLLR